MPTYERKLLVTYTLRERGVLRAKRITSRIGRATAQIVQSTRRLGYTLRAWGYWKWRALKAKAWRMWGRVKRLAMKVWKAMRVEPFG